MALAQDLDFHGLKNGLMPAIFLCYFFTYWLLKHTFCVIVVLKCKLLARLFICRVLRPIVAQIFHLGVTKVVIYSACGELIIYLKCQLLFGFLLCVLCEKCRLLFQDVDLLVSRCRLLLAVLHME